MSTEIIVAVIAGLLFGTLVAFLNSRISKKMIYTKSNSFLAIGNILRLLIDAAALAVGFIVCKITGLSVAIVLLSIAIGLTVGGTLFLVLMTRKISNKEQNQTTDREERGE